jgi:drug/metabolite transporter (DMT)-like permease
MKQVSILTASSTSLRSPASQHSAEFTPTVLIFSRIVFRQSSTSFEQQIGVVAIVMGIYFVIRPTVKRDFVLYRLKVALAVRL